MLYNDRDTSTPSASGRSFPSRLARLLHFDIPHVDLLVHQQNRSPPPFLSPVLRIRSFLYIHDLDFRTMILHPFPAMLVHNRHEIALAVVLVLRLRSVIVIPFVQNHSNQSILACGLRVFNRLKPELMIYISIEQNIIEEIVLLFSFTELFEI